MVQNDYLPKPDTLFRACKNIKTPKDILKASEDFKTNAKQFENDIKELKFLRNDLVQVQLALRKGTDQLIQNLVDVMHDTKKLESELEALVEMMKEYDRHGDMWTRRGLDHLKALKNMSNTYDKAQGVKREIAKKAYEKAFRNASHDMQMASEFVAESEKSEKALSQILKLDYIDKLKQLSKVIKALRTSTSNYEINVESVKGIFEKAVKLTKQANK